MSKRSNVAYSRYIYEYCSTFLHYLCCFLLLFSSSKAGKPMSHLTGRWSSSFRDIYNIRGADNYQPLTILVIRRTPCYSGKETLHFTSHLVGSPTERTNARLVLDARLQQCRSGRYCFGVKCDYGKATVAPAKSSSERSPLFYYAERFQKNIDRVVDCSQRIRVR